MDISTQVVHKVARRLLWILIAFYFCAVMDRGNVSFAALSMNKAIGLTAQMFGIGVGIMFIPYSLFEVPSNLVLARYGARFTLARIAILWGLATTLMVFTRGPKSFYALRAFLGMAEAGLFPGVMLYLRLWFPSHYRARYNAMFNLASPLAYVCSSIISGAIMGMDGVGGLPGWKWLFLLEGSPSILLGIIAIFYLTNTPKDAAWLALQEKEWLQTTLEREAKMFDRVQERNLWQAACNPYVLSFGLTYFGICCGLVGQVYWLPTIVRSFGLSFRQVGVVSAMPPFAGLIGMFLLSRRSDRKQERIYHTICAMLLAAAGFAFAALGRTPVLIIAGFMMTNIGLYTAMSVFWAIPQSYLSKEIAPGSIGVISMIGTIGNATTPMVIGHLRDTTHGFTAGFLLLSAVGIAVCVIVFIVGLKLRAHRVNAIAATGCGS
jgi:ACS family tartrate transporter-like MFS transporter